MTPPLRYLKHTNFSLRYLEWVGLLKLLFEEDQFRMRDAYRLLYPPNPEESLSEQYDIYNDAMSWSYHFHDEVSKMLKKDRAGFPSRKDQPIRDRYALYKRIFSGEIKTLDELYTAIDFVSGPTLNKAQVNAAKKVVGQRGYQKEKLGEDFISNNTLISQAKALANFELAATQPSDADLYAIIKHLDSVAELTYGQRSNLIAFIRKRLSKFTAIDTVEAAIARKKDRAAALLWLQIKAHHRLGDIPFKLGQTRVIELIGGSATKVNAACTVLVECGAIKKLSSGVKGKAGNPAAQYKRLV